MRISFKRIAIIFLIGLFGFLNFFNFQAQAADDAGDIQSDINKLQKKAEQIQQDLNASQGLLQKTTSQVVTTQSLIQKTASEISRKEAEVKNLNDRLELNKKILSEYVRQVYYTNQENLVIEAILKDNNLSDILGNFSQSLGVKDRILNLLEEIKKSKGELEKNKTELVDKKDEHEKLLSIQKSEQNEIKQDVEETQATLAEIQQKISKLRSNLNKILGGSYNTEDIKDAIKFASKVTGVRKGFLFGVLSYESGGNTNAGNCTYKNCGMNATRKTYFDKICKELDFDCEKKPLSCASKNYSGSGGAMGAAQFMSDTWWGYKSRIASATGHNPPNPWSLIDGVVAMALKLENDGATESGSVSIKNPCNGKSVKVKWEIYASMRYLGWNCYGYTNYAPGIQSLAKGYDNL